MEMDKQAGQRRQKDVGQEIGVRKSQKYGYQYDNRQGNIKDVFRALEKRRC